MRKSAELGSPRIASVENHRYSVSLKMSSQPTQTDSIIEVLIFLAVGLLAIRGLAWNQVKGFLARGWMTCQGTVEFGSVEERHTRYKNFYIAVVDYSYSVDGEYYSGHLERVFLLESSADGFVSGMKGQMVFVRYNPRRPDHSVLLKQDQPGGWPSHSGLASRL